MATTRYAQPALFAVECGTAAALRAAGVVPAAVLGHSLGELAAACTAGVMSLAEVGNKSTPRSGRNKSPLFAVLDSLFLDPARVGS